MEKGAGLLYRKRRIERGNGLDNFFIQKNMTAREAGMTIKEYTAQLGISKRLLADIKFGGGDLLVNGRHGIYPNGTHLNSSSCT